VWALRDERVTSLVIGASSVEQLEQNVGALASPVLTDGELARIDDLLVAATSVDLWRSARLGQL
jgi:L-glyceraldehyde 3-phosphate reductase